MTDDVNDGAIVVDQGIESNEIGSGDDIALDADLVETQFIIELDNRLGYLADPTSAAAIVTGKQQWLRR